MTAPVENVLADKVVMALRALPDLGDFKVYANWGKENGQRLFAEGGCKDPRVVYAYVRPRRHEEYTTLTATVGVELAVRVDKNSRSGGVRPEDAYIEIVGLLEGWHGSIGDVKEALGSDFFDPVGMRLDGGGEWDVGEDKAQNFVLPFTVKEGARGE